MNSAAPLLQLILLLCFLLTPAHAEVVTVRQGGVIIQVHAPEGYSLLERESEGFKQFRAQKDTVGNEVLAVFLPSARTDEERDYTRIMDVSVIKSLKGNDVTKAHLAGMRHTMESQSEEVLKSAKKTSGLPGLVIEPAHDFTDRYFSFVARSRAEDGAEECDVGTFAVIRGRMWTFYVRSTRKTTPDEVAWLKTAAKSWITAVLAANPSDAATLAKEDRSGKGLFEDPDNSGGLAYKLGRIAGPLLVVFIVVKFITRKKKVPES